MIKKYTTDEGLLVYGLCIVNTIVISLFFAVNF